MSFQISEIKDLSKLKRMGLRSTSFQFFSKRIQAFLDINSPLRFAFQMDLSNLDLYDPGI